MKRPNASNEFFKKKKDKKSLQVRISQISSMENNCNASNGLSGGGMERNGFVSSSTSAPRSGSRMMFTGECIDFSHIVFEC